MLHVRGVRKRKYSEACRSILITLVASAYSYRELRGGEEAGARMKLFWAILLIMLPIALLFS